MYDVKIVIITLLILASTMMSSEHPAWWHSVNKISYTHPDFKEVQEYNTGKLDSLFGFKKNYRHIDEYDYVGYNNLYKWTDAAIVSVYPSIDEYSISDANKSYVYWVWGEQHINHARKEFNGSGLCANYTNIYEQNVVNGRMFYPAHMTFTYYNLSTEIPITFFYEIEKYCPDVDVDNCQYYTNNDGEFEEVWKGGYDGFFENYIIPDINKSVSYLNESELENYVKFKQIPRHDFENNPSGCEPPNCNIVWYYYYINPVPVPYNQTQYDNLFNRYNNRTYMAEPRLNITLKGSVKIRVEDYKKEYVYDMRYNQCTAETNVKYKWLSRSPKTEEKDYFVELGDIEWFHITPVLGEEINHNPVEEFVTFANRRMQRGYSLIDSEPLTNYYVKLFDIFKDEFGIEHVGTTNINKADFIPPEDDPLLPHSFNIPHTTKVNSSEKLYAPYQITRSNHSFRWVNYYNIYFKYHEGMHNFTHTFYDVFGNNFTLSRNIYLRLPTWIINNKVYAYKRGAIGVPHVNNTGFGTVESYYGDDSNRPSMTIINEPGISFPNVAVIFGGIVGLIVAVMLIGRRMI